MPRIPARHALLLRTVRASVSLPFLRRPLSPLAVHLVAPAPFVVGERLRGLHAVRPVRLPERGIFGARTAGHGSVRTRRAPRVVAGRRGRRMEEIPGWSARAPPGTRRSRGGGIGGWGRGSHGMDEDRTAALLPPACGRLRLSLPLPDGGAEPVEKRHRRRWQAVRLARRRLLDGPGRGEDLVHRDGIARCVGRVGEVGDSSRAGALVGEFLLEVSTLRPPKDRLRGTERGGRGIPLPPATGPQPWGGGQ